MQVEGIRVQRDPFSPFHAQRVALWRQRIWDAIQAARTQAEFQIAGAMHDTHDSGYLSTLGWHALHNGYLKQAQDYFRAALHYDPYLIGAWFGLSRAAWSPEERRVYLQAAIDLQLLVSDVARHHEI
ncbi:MAG TPA: hypothetical protein VFZ66_04960 [Herpetosiphonaceae bacterium]